MNKLYRLSFLISLILITESGYSQIKVTLLGTGNPQPSIERFGPSTLVEVNGQYFLFDCGRGVSQRLWQQKIQLGKVHKLFLTHLHSDHTVGIPDLWLTGWLPANFGRRNNPLEVWGPPGTTQMMQGLQTAYRWDVETRDGEKNKIDSAISIKSHEIKEGIVYNDEKIKITAFLVDHADFIDYAFGFRLDYGGHSVVISGDTRYNENLIKYAKGTDVLIHEVAVARPELIEKSATARQILSFHTSPEDAGKVFYLVNPKLAVYSHIALVSTDPNLPPPTKDDIIPRTRKNFAGRLEVGEDLMTIEIGNTVEIKKL
jgi:ribonuclease Z